VRYGDPAGHGRYGILDHDDGRPICHECGRAYHQLATHLRGSHQITAEQYRAAYGLGATTRLVSTQASERMAQAWERHAQSHLDRLAQRRNPHAAAQHSRAAHGHDPQGWAPEVRARRQQLARSRRGRDLTPEEAATLGDGVDLRVWADAARRLLALPDVHASSLARAADISPATVHQRLRRYPPI